MRQKKKGQSLVLPPNVELLAHRQALLIPWAAVLSPVKCTCREHVCRVQGSGCWWVQMIIRQAPCLTCLKELQPQRHASFSQWGKDLYQEKPYIWKTCFEELVYYITRCHLGAGPWEKLCQLPTMGKARLEINVICFNFWTLNLTTVFVSLLALVPV